VLNCGDRDSSSRDEDHTQLPPKGDLLEFTNLSSARLDNQFNKDRNSVVIVAPLWGIASLEPGFPFSMDSDSLRYY